MHTIDSAAEKVLLRRLKLLKRNLDADKHRKHVVFCPSDTVAAWVSHRLTPSERTRVELQVRGLFDGVLSHYSIYDEACNIPTEILDAVKQGRSE